MLYPKVIETGRAGAARRVPPSPPARRVALMTGGGIGWGSAIARRLARDGMAVAVHDVAEAPRAHELVAAIRRDGGVAGAFTADVTDERAVAELAVAVAGALGPVDALVFGPAGAPPPPGPVTLLRALLPGMRAKRSGRIVQVETAEGVRADLTRSWARELAPLGITVNTIASLRAGRSWTPEDVAHAVSFVASQAARAITGQRIVVGGGRGLLD